MTPQQMTPNKISESLNMCVNDFGIFFCSDLFSNNYVNELRSQFINHLGKFRAHLYMKYFCDHP